MIVSHGDDLLALLMLVARVANPIAPFLATVLVPSPWSRLRSSFFSAARWPTLAMNARWRVMFQKWTLSQKYAMMMSSSQGGCHGAHFRALSPLSKRSGY